MNNTIGVVIPLNFNTIVVCICITSFLLMILQFIELIRFNKYGKVPETEKVDCKECLWRHEVKSGKNVSVPHCIRPAIFSKDTICKGQCKEMRYQNIPGYPKSLVTFVLESLLAVINFVIIVLTFTFNISA